jgi:phosphoribosylanthranilate isomerase
MGNRSILWRIKKKIAKEIEIIKVFSIIDSFDFEVLKISNPFAIIISFDTKGKLPGGNGSSLIGPF